MSAGREPFRRIGLVASFVAAAFVALKALAIKYLPTRFSMMIVISSGWLNAA